MVPFEHAAPRPPIISFKPVGVPAAEAFLDDRGDVENLRTTLGSSLTVQGKGFVLED